MVPSDGREERRVKPARVSSEGRFGRAEARFCTWSDPYGSSAEWT